MSILIIEEENDAMNIYDTSVISHNGNPPHRSRIIIGGQYVPLLTLCGSVALSSVLKPVADLTGSGIIIPVSNIEEHSQDLNLLR